MTAKYKQKFLLSISVLLVSSFSLPSLATACNLFNWSDCNDSASVIYCQPGDNCSLSGGTSIVANNINDIEKNKKFSQYIQDVVAYLLLFLGIVGVLYIIYAGFNIVIAGGDEEKVKKGKKTILHVFAGLVLIFLAFSIVRFVIGQNGQGGILNNVFNEFPSLVETTYAYTDYDTNTFDFYKKKIELLSSALDQEYQVNNKITPKTLGELSSLVVASMDTFPDSEDIIYNTNLAKSLMTAIELVKKAPDSDTYITNLAKNLNDYLNKIKVKRITGKVTSSPESGNAPLTVTLRAADVIDPSGVTILKNSYIWWIRASGGGRSIIGTGPSLAYTFQEERTYTVFLNILSASRNAKGKMDVLPFNSSVNIKVLPKLGNMYVFINSSSVSFTDGVKFTPAIGRLGLLIDATSSIPATGTKFLHTSWDFGNGNTRSYDGSPQMERQIYANEWTYKARLEVITNENQKIVKEFFIEVHDPIASINADKKSGFPGEEFKFNLSTNTTMRDLVYQWNIIDLENNKSLYTSNLQNITYKFPRVGNYSVKLKTQSPNGKNDTDTVNIIIDGRDPIASFESKVVSSETPNTIMFDATKSYDPDTLESSNLTFAWIVDGDHVDLSSSSRNGSIGKYTFDTIGTHKVTLEVSNKSGKTTTYNRDVIIDSLLAVKLIVSPKIVVAGLSVTLIADAKEARIFEWQFGDGENDISTSGRMSHVYKKSGTYNVSLTVRGTSSMSSNTISRRVYVMNSNSPFAIISMKRDNDEIIQTPDVCDGKEAFVIDRSKAVAFSAENSVNVDGNNSGLSYTWKYGSRTSSQRDFSYKFDELGCFPVTLTVRSQKTGKIDTTKSYVLIENLLPKLSSISVEANKLESDPVTVTVTANNAFDDDGAIVSYTWYYYTEDDPEPQDFRITRSPKTVFVLPRITGKYYFAVILEDSNGAKVNSDESTQQKYSITLTADNINTPIITLKTSSAAVAVGDKVDYDVSVRNILGNDIASKSEYKWDFNGDGFYEETTNVPKTSHVYDKPGNFNFKVKVTYKGISNTKYQMIVVKNEIIPNLEYIAIGKKFVFFNTTKGLYSKVKWTIGNAVSSSNPTSFTYDFGDEDVSGDVTLEVSDGKDTKSITVSLKKDIINALRTKKSEEKLIAFTYPSIDDDVIHIKDASEKIFVYMGESKGTPVKYSIDTDIMVDTNLNGDPTDDADNKGTDSYVNGSPFVIKGFDSSSREKTIRLSTYDINNTLIASKNIKVIFDFATWAGISETLSGSTSEMPKDISEKDKADMETLKDLIKSAREQDRLKMMQYFSALQENWFDTREKTKTIIDFENYVDTSAGIDAKTKESFYSILEGFLLADTQVKGDIGLATKVLKTLIPKTNPAYTQIMKNIDEILSHPTNTPLNKELGKAILEAIKNDTTIENKDKLIIKSQLEVIIAGGQENLVQQQAPISNQGGGFSILAFISGFVKLFGYALAFILGLFLLAFVYFKIFNKQEHLWFQDFLIEKFFHGGGDSYVSATKTTPSTPSPSVVKQDVLSNMITTESISRPEEPTASESIQPIKKVDTLNEFTKSITSEEGVATEEHKMEKEMVVPDWLKQASSLSFPEESPTITSSEEPKQDTAEEIPQTEIETTTISDQVEAPIELPQATDTIASSELFPESDVLPDWLKSSTSISEENKESVPVEEITPIAESSEETPHKSETTGNDSEELPDWLRSMDQTALMQEVEKELNEPSDSTSPFTDQTSESNVEEDTSEIPDWLRSASVVTVPPDSVHEAVLPEESPIEAVLPDITEKKHRPQKKDPVQQDSETPVIETSSEPKKKKATLPKKEKLSAPNVTLPEDADLPDWLK